MTALRASSRLAPRNPLPELALGRVHLDRGEAADAAAAFRRALERQPKLAPALEGIGDAESMAGKATAAREAYVAALAITPRDAHLHVKLGALAAAGQQYAEAERAFTAAIRADEGYAAAYNNLAWTILQQPRPSRERLTQALAHAERATRLDPGFARAADARRRVAELEG